MVQFFIHLLVSAALLLLVSRVVTGIHIDDWTSAILGALVLGFVNAIVRPIMLVLTLPFTILTFGLFLLVLNGLMLWLASAFVPGFRIDGFGPAFLGALLLSLLNMLIAWMVGPQA
ncbi:MAG TPA: phage holin family protein [Myxococcota bacterium]|nr:phage holin family protein [Myxococcota bacterium]